ncbi:hypothetical protein VNO77_39122 [Canavalia gladiata]|uniref:Uncharacterized protein n=1 Tax=Canavalia gladiata TaxID=3824 RepID=A0AAN9KAJ3_CANGL
MRFRKRKLLCYPHTLIRELKPDSFPLSWIKKGSKEILGGKKGSGSLSLIEDPLQIPSRSLKFVHCKCLENSSISSVGQGNICSIQRSSNNHWLAFTASQKLKEKIRVHDYEGTMQRVVIGDGPIHDFHDSVTYNELMVVYVRVGFLDERTVILDTIANRGVQPDTLTCDMHTSIRGVTEPRKRGIESTNGLIHVAELCTLGGNPLYIHNFLFANSYQ